MTAVVVRQSPRQVVVRPTMQTVAIVGGDVGNWDTLRNKPALGAAGGLATLDGATKLAQNLDASHVTSGTLAVGRVPDLDAAKIVSGAFAKARIPDLSDTYGPKVPPLIHLDAYTNFIGGAANVFVAGQATTATTTTGTVAAGATTMTVADATGFVAGVSILTNKGTAQQQVNRIASVAGSTLTLVAANVTPLASGATVDPFWVNSSHLTNPAGMTAYAYWIANYKINGTLALQDPGVQPIVYLGDSWFSQGGDYFETAVHALYPAATVTKAGVAGNTSQMMLDRFDTDVPATAKYVIFNEPGVNDVSANLTAATIAANLEKLVAKIRAIGAIPVYAGIVPLSDFLTASAARHTETAAQIGDGTQFPAQSASAIATRYPITALNVATAATSLGLGIDTQKALTSGTNNTGFGQSVQTALTTATNNTAVGYNAQRDVTTASANTGVGYLAQRACTGAANTGVGAGVQSAVTGSSNVGIGQNSQLSMSSGAGNVAVGTEAQWNPAGVSANATTTGQNSVAVGYQSGQSSATQRTNSVGVGYRALYGGTGAVAVGALASATNDLATALGNNASASGSGSVAIGVDATAAGATATAQEDFILGTARHHVKVRGTLGITTKTPTSTADASGSTGDIAYDDSFFYVKTSAGWKRAALATF